MRPHFLNNASSGVARPWHLGSTWLERYCRGQETEEEWVLGSGEHREPVKGSEGGK